MTNTNTERDTRPSGIFNSNLEPYLEALHDRIDTRQEQLNTLEAELEAILDGVDDGEDPRIDSLIESIATLESRLDVLRAARDVQPINVVASEEIDHEGDLAAEILEWLADHTGPAPRFVLPAGSYRWETTFDPGPLPYVGIVSPSEAVLEVTSHGVEMAFKFGDRRRSVGRVELRNLTVDISDEDDRDAGITQAHVAESAILENVHLLGERHRAGPHGGSKFSCMVNMTEPEAVGSLRNVTLLGGDRETGGRFDGAIAFATDPPHEGTLFLEGCSVANNPDNGFYMANAPGAAHLRNCTAKNNGGGNIRLGRNDSAEDCRIVLDHGDDVDRPGCGLWLCNYNDEDDPDEDLVRPPRAEGIVIDASDARNHAVRLNDVTDGAVLRDIEVYVGPDSTGRSVMVKGDGDLPVRIDGLHLVDEASRDFALYAHREDVSYRNVSVEATQRRGVHCDGRGSTFETCDFKSSDVALDILADDVDVVGLEATGDVRCFADGETITWERCRVDGTVAGGLVSATDRVAELTQRLETLESASDSGNW